MRNGIKEPLDELIRSYVEHRNSRMPEFDTPEKDSVNAEIGRLRNLQHEQRRARRKLEKLAERARRQRVAA